MGEHAGKKQNGSALKFASKNLRDNKEIVLLAVSKKANVKNKKASVNIFNYRGRPVPVFSYTRFR